MKNSSKIEKNFKNIGPTGQVHLRQKIYKMLKKKKIPHKNSLNNKLLCVPDIKHKIKGGILTSAFKYFFYLPSLIKQILRATGLKNI